MSAQPPFQPFSYKFGAWKPDRPHLVNPAFPPNMEEYFNGGQIALTTAQNAIWTAQGYRPYFPLVGGPALPAACLGAIAAYDTSGVLHVYAGTATDLYSLESGAWVNRSKVAGGYTSTGWTFQTYGNCCYATDYNDVIQSLTMGAATAFADLDDTDPAPKARVLGILRDFLVAGNLFTAANGASPHWVQWSAVSNPASWPLPNTQQAYAALAGTQALYSEYGPVMAISDNESFGLIFQRSGIVRAEYVGGNTVFQFYTYEKKRGALGPNAVARVGNKYYFASPDGFFMTDGGNTTPIGYEHVDNWFFANAKGTSLNALCAAADTQNKVIYFAFQSNSGSTLDSILAYNYVEQQWSYCQQPQEMMFQGLTAEGAWQPFGFTPAHTYGGFSGPPTNAVLETMDFNFNSGGRALISMVRSLSQGAAQMRVGARPTPIDSVVWTPYYAGNARDNVAGLRAEGAFHRVGVQLAGDFGFSVGCTVWPANAGVL